MRRLARTVLVAAVALGAAVVPALAGVKVKERTSTYGIAGRSGEDLIAAMDRKGPRHGFLTRAIAQTRYSVGWTIEWGETRTACRVKRADGELSITYFYPKVTSPMSADLGRRWTRFMSGVRRHEQMHGTMARQMAKAVERSISGLTIRDDPGCVKARREAKRRMSAVYADYEARQVAYDAREHRTGGPVEKLITALEAGRR